MADWYCGSVQYAAVAQWAASHAYSVGDIVRQLATPAVGSERCFRCTTAGTSGGSEPSWSLGKGATTVSGTATFTEVTGNSAYGWSAPFARISTPIGATTWMSAGDTLYVAHDHDATSSSSLSIGSGSGSSTNPIRIICVNAAGSTPPVSADLRDTAKESTTGASSITFAATSQSWHMRGVTWTAGSGANTAFLFIHNGSGACGVLRFERCGLFLGGSTGTSSLRINQSSAGKVVFEDCDIGFAGTGQDILVENGQVQWRGGALVGPTIPNTLISSNPGGQALVQVEGVDLSAAGSGKTLVTSLNTALQASIVNCKLDPSVGFAVAPSTSSGARADLIVSDSAAEAYRQERVSLAGALTTETTYVRTGGASDGEQAISWKIDTSANVCAAFPFETFQIAKWNAMTGSALTATVEIENGGVTLTNADVWMEIEYLGDAGSPLASFVSCGLADPLATGANLPSSSESWEGSLASAVKQKLSVSFTPQMKGLVRARIYVARASTTVYVDPKLTLA